MLDLGLRLDHVLVAVADLDAATADFEQRYGLLSVEGGRHPGVGTANRIVPFGNEYLELIAVVEPAEAAGNWLGRRVADAVRSGDRFVTWAVRTSDLDGFTERCRRLGMALPPSRDGSRRKPDGSVLRWRSQDLTPHPEVGMLPFVIEWHVPESEHPAAQVVEQPSHATGVARLNLGATNRAEAEPMLRNAIGETVALVVTDALRDGIIEVRLSSPTGEIAIR